MTVMGIVFDSSNDGCQIWPDELWKRNHFTGVEYFI